MENFNFCAVRKSYHFLPKNQYCQCGVPIVKNTFVADGVTQIVKKKFDTVSETNFMYSFSFLRN